MASMLVLDNGNLRAVVDPGNGCDIVDLTFLETRTELLFATPWRSHAQDIRERRSLPTSADSQAQWLERYRGGWQLLCPNAGAERVVNGAPLGFHGEASLTSWSILSQEPHKLHTQASLFSMPIRIDREMSLDGSSITVFDRLTNAGLTDLEIDYVQHPAFSEALLRGGCRIDTGASTFVVDSQSRGLLAAPGSEHSWPIISTVDGGTHDLARTTDGRLAAPILGWLKDFGEYWITISNDSLGLTVRLDWDGRFMPYAWIWEELNSTSEWPWFGRGRTVALEPASTPTSGEDRRSVLHIPSHESVEVSITLSVSLSEK